MHNVTAQTTEKRECDEKKNQQYVCTTINMFQELLQLRPTEKKKKK